MGAPSHSKMLLEPFRGMIDDRFHCARFWKEMTGTRDDDQPALTTDARQRLLVEFDDATIVSTDDQKCRGPDILQCRPREVGSSAPRHHSTDAMRKLRRCYESGRCAGTCAKQADSELGGRRVFIKPVHSPDESVGQERNIEYIGPVGLFLCCQQIEQQRCKSSSIERACNRRVARTKAAGTAAMRKRDQATHLLWNSKGSSKA
jgi:hypothetical protein